MPHSLRHETNTYVEYVKNIYLSFLKPSRLFPIVHKKMLLAETMLQKRAVLTKLEESKREAGDSADGAAAEQNEAPAEAVDDEDKHESGRQLGEEREKERQVRVRSCREHKNK